MSRTLGSLPSRVHGHSLGMPSSSSENGNGTAWTLPFHFCTIAWTVHLEHNASKPVEGGLNGTGARDSNLKWDNGTRGTMVKDAQGK